MEQYRKTDPLNLNGLFKSEDEKKKRNYKLIVDPAMRQGHVKVYRFDGIMPGDPSPVIVRDPRSRIKRYWRKIEAVNLPIPKFKYDQYYVGAILPKEVTFTNLNDNIDQSFLKEMCKGFGVIEDVKIYFHPKTKKHLGIGKVVYSSTKSARACAEKLNQTSKMGIVMNVFVDAMGKERQRILEEATIEKPKFRPPSPPHRKSFKDPKLISPEFKTPDLRTSVNEYPTPGSSVDPGYGSGSLSVGQSDQFSLPTHTPRTPHTPSTPGSLGQPAYHTGFNQFPPQPSVPRPQNVPYNVGGMDEPGYKYGMPVGHQGNRPGQSYYNSKHDEVLNDGCDYHDGYSHQQGYRRGNRHGRARRDSDDWSSGGLPNHGHRHRERHHNDRPHHRDGDSRYDGADYLPGDRDSYSQDGESFYHHRHRARSRDDDYYISDSQQTLKDESPPAELPVAPVQSTASEVKEEPSSEEPRFMSLESRIQSLLSANKDLDLPFGSSDEAASSSEERLEMPRAPESEAPPPPLPYDQPPLPEAPLPPEEPTPPPLPPEPAPPPTPEDEQPPLPPEPEPHCDTNTYDSSDCVQHPPGEDDDCMSLSSISSGEEKLQLNAPIIDNRFAQQAMSSMMYVPNMMWYPPMNQYQNYLNNAVTTNSMIGGSMNLEAMQQKAAMLFTRQDEDNENMFLDVLDQIVQELKMVMCKDMHKKMVEGTAFKFYEAWLETKENKDKLRRAQAGSQSSSRLVSPAVAPTSVTSKEPSSLSSLISGKEAEAPVKDMSSTLASLFESKDGSSGFGVGGLLGLRAGIPKMPSFRKKFRPPSPPEEEEEEFRGPRTPEESENEDKDEKSELDEETEGDMRSRRKSMIYSSDSEEAESDKDEEDEEEEEEEDEEDSEASVASSEEEEEEEEDDDDESEEESEEESEDEAECKAKEEEKLDSIKTEAEEKMQVDEIKSEKEEKDDMMEVETKMDKIKSESEGLSPVKDTNSGDAEKFVKSDAVEEKIDVKPKELNNGELNNKSEIDVVTVKEETEEGKQKDKDKSDGGLEQDAIMALLQMRNEVSAATVQPEEVTPTAVPSPKEEKPRPETPPHIRQLRQVQLAMAAEHNYFAPMKSPEKKQKMSKRQAEMEEVTDSASEGEPELEPCLPPEIEMDHNYCQPYFPIDSEPKTSPVSKDEDQRSVQADMSVETPADVTLDAAEMEVSDDTAKTPSKETKRGRKSKKKLADVTNLHGSRELANLLPPPIKPRPKFSPRSFQEEFQNTYDFLLNGIDQEDINFLKRRYEELLQDDSPQTYWLNDTHWVDHAHTKIPDPVPPKKKRKTIKEETLTAHKTGCARTEGYYKITNQQKTTYLKSMRGVQSQGIEDDLMNFKDVDSVSKKKIQQSREARSESRRWQSVLSSMGEDVGDLIKFNQLTFRKKQLKFARSGIHDWGLFALEPIVEGSMVIEYVGQVVRQTVADLREKKYEAMGIGSSYLFRIDHDTIIDATKCGNLARFINHSCNPNCYAKIIPVESQKKIVIYSKRDIDVNEEITYDYKFPLEDQKIPCWCNAPNCRGSLN